MPGDKGGQAAWYTNMAGNFGGVATVLEFNAADTAAWIADCNYAAFVLGPMGDPGGGLRQGGDGVSRHQGSRRAPRAAHGPTGRRGGQKAWTASRPRRVHAAGHRRCCAEPTPRRARPRSVQGNGQGSVNVAFSKASSHRRGQPVPPAHGRRGAGEGRAVHAHARDGFHPAQDARGARAAQLFGDGRDRGRGGGRAQRGGDGVGEVTPGRPGGSNGGPARRGGGCPGWRFWGVGGG